ncbi:MAG: M1 family metallopeptidase [Candidatus Levyibacteriota bacterium]
MAGKTSQTKLSVRLSKEITPLKYTIHFEPDFENFTFVGNESIDLELKKSTRKIRMHSAELEILSAELIQGKKSLAGKPLYKDAEEEVDFEFDSVIQKGKATLKLSFTGILNDKMRGFYRSKYEIDGKTHHMGVTQFESTDARRAFPCFDEPSHKSIFEVSFKVPSDRAVISNTIESEVVEHQGGFKTVRFTPSPLMSSYLLAFIIGHFEKIESKTRDGVVVRVYVTPGKKKQAEFALEVAVKCLEFYTDYFNIKYPLPTMDLIAIPDFAAGAMENWGAVTYRETALLVDPENTSTHNKQWVALVIAHELAHQWFGNLVTMEWWTHLWLNEGFASYMEYVAVNHLFPEWNVWTQFVYMDHARALELDSLANTHPIEVDVSHPAEISEIFDDVSYAKGASVIRMLADYLGETAFRNGLRKYLKRHSYANAQTTHLWEALEEVSKKPVKKMMQNWTRKPGYPLILVEQKGASLKLSQQRFLSSVVSQKKVKDTTLWLAPISISAKTSKKTIHTLLDKKSSLVKNMRDAGWLKLNRDETSFIRVKYSEELFEKLIEPIKKQDKHLSEQDRFGILRDTFVLSEAGYISTDSALELAKAYVDDESYIVWAELATELAKVKNIIYSQPYYPAFEQMVRELFTPIGRKLGWEKRPGEEHAQTLLRPMVLGLLGRSGDPETIKTAQRLFEQDKKGRVIQSDLRAIVYSLVVENGGVGEYEYFLDKYKKEQFQEEKDRILRALCIPKDKKLLEKTLDFAFTDHVKAQDSFKIIAFVWSNPAGKDLAWKKVQEEWGSIVKKFAGGHLFSRFVKPAANFTVLEKAKEVAEFFKTHESKGLERTVAQVVEQIKSNAQWLERDGKKLEKFFK